MPPLRPPESGAARESPLRLPRSRCRGGLPPGAGLASRQLHGRRFARRDPQAHAPHGWGRDWPHEGGHPPPEQGWNKPAGSGRRFGSAVAVRADPSALDTPPTDDDHGAEGAPSWQRTGSSREPDAGSPVTYAPVDGIAPPTVGVAAVRPAERLGRMGDGDAPGGAFARAQDEPLLAPHPADGVGGARRGGSDDETMPLAGTRPSPSDPMDDASMAVDGGDGETPVLAAHGTPPDAPMTDGSGTPTHSASPCPMGPVTRPPPDASMPDGSGGADPPHPSRRPCLPPGWGRCGPKKEGAVSPGPQAESPAGLGHVYPAQHAEQGDLP